MKSKDKIAIIGQGYVGLPLSVAAAESGLLVIGIDVDAYKVDSINSGTSPVEDITNSRLKKVIGEKRLEATTDFSSVRDVAVIVICVPTPLNENLEPDLGFLESAVKSIVPYLSDDTLIISESTSYPGTLRDLIFEIVKNNYSGDLNSIYFASAPERVNPGDSVWHIGNTPRLIGGINSESTKLAEEFYRRFCSEIVLTESPEIAEAAKILENTFRLVNIALLNELNRVFDSKGIDTNAVVDAASTKPYGYMPFRSGVGIGGHCIPIDPVYLTWWADQNGVDSKLVKLADNISRTMPRFVAEKALRLGKNIKKVLVLGVAYKSGLADTRETPVKELVEHLSKLGCQVAWHDPLVETWNGSKCEAITWPCDLAIVATNQPGIDLDLITSTGTPVLDCTNSYRGRPGIISL